MQSMHRKFLVTVPIGVDPGATDEAAWISSGLDAIIPLAGFRLTRMDFGSNPKVTFKVEGWIDDETFVLLNMKYDVNATRGKDIRASLMYD